MRLELVVTGTLQRSVSTTTIAFPIRTALGPVEPLSRIAGQQTLLRPKPSSPEACACSYLTQHRTNRCHGRLPPANLPHFAPRPVLRESRYLPTQRTSRLTDETRFLKLHHPNLAQHITTSFRRHDHGTYISRSKCRSHDPHFQGGPVKFKQIEFKVLTAAISVSSYWNTFVLYKNGTAGIAANATNVEDTGITIVAIEIVLRSLHRAYYNKVGKAQGSDEQLKSSESVASGEASIGHKAAAGSGVACLPNQAPADISAPDEATVVQLEDPKGVEAHFPQRLWSVDIDDVWGVLALVNLGSPSSEYPGKFDVDWTVVSPWYRVWRRASFATFNTQPDFEKALFSAFAFKDEEGFKSATRWLCQNTSVGNIAEYSPLVHSQGTQWYLHLHLPREVICESLNPFPRFSTRYTYQKSSSASHRPESAARKGQRGNLVHHSW